MLTTSAERLSAGVPDAVGNFLLNRYCPKILFNPGVVIFVVRVRGLAKVLCASILIVYLVSYELNFHHVSFREKV